VDIESEVGNSITVDHTGVTVRSSNAIKLEAGGVVDISAAMVNVNAGMAKFSRVVQADTVIADSIVGSSYAPGAGNIW